MKIVMVHALYQQRAGEDTVLSCERRFLAAFARENDGAIGDRAGHANVAERARDLIESEP